MISKTLILMLSLSFGVGLLGNIAVGQQQAANNTSSIPLSANDTLPNEILNSLQILVQQNEKLIQQNDDSSKSAVISSYIGMLAFLTGLSLVISENDKVKVQDLSKEVRGDFRDIETIKGIPVGIQEFFNRMTPFGKFK